jgi:uncharacterized membrane protein YdjX (TVP38/TMEM64 family)
VNADSRTDAASTARNRRVAILRLVAFAALIAATLLIAWRWGYFQLDERRKLGDIANRLHVMPGSEVAYVVLYAVAVAMVLPAAVMTLLGGAVFGPWEGASLAWLGAMLGTCLAHLLARRVLRSAILRTLGDHRILRRLRERADIMALFRLRVLPVAPFATLDYLAGAAGVALRRVLAATAIGVVPSVVAYSYVGAELTRSMRAGHAASHRALWLAGGVTVAMLLLSMLPVLVQRFRD